MEISNLDSKIKSTSPGDPVLEANSSIHQQAIATSSPTVIYTPYYCEENVYQLLSSLSQTVKNRSYAVFISNPARTCILFQQKASQRDEHDGFFVVWDYHVIVVTVLTDTDSVCVLDRDSRLPYSCSLSKYVEETFRPALFTSGILPRELESRFRVVPSSDFLSNFASDRSHMLANQRDSQPGETHLPSTQLYIKPPPLYPPIAGPGAILRAESHNLWTRFLEMNDAKDADWQGFGATVTSPFALLRFSW